MIEKQPLASQWPVLISSIEHSVSGASRFGGTRGDTINPMKTQDLTRFANCPWQAIGEADAAHWLARKRQFGPAEGIRMAAELHALVKAQRPDWPTPAEREADLAMHARVSEALRSVADLRTA